MALYLTDPHSPPSIAWYWPQVAGALIGGILGVGLVSSLRRRHLTYDSQTRTVTARDRIWGLWREYPCEGFDRLEYEAGTGRLYQVRADGKRRRVPVDRHEAVRAEWRAFIDQFERDHAPAEPESS
ncbi:hypothetical protein [Glycomyces sp. NPDC021274]|uniref:hypothetical protein n=1 Tax=Glycomyces sp. NPDC021274 TaxID=3155120 RepID=UPI0033EBE6CA